MPLSNEEFLLLSEEEKYKVLKENNITIHPYIWILLCDYLKNSITSIYWSVASKLESDKPESITAEDAKVILTRCDKLKKAMEKMQNELLKKDQEHG